MKSASPGDLALELVAWMTYGSLLLVAVLQLSSMQRAWKSLRTLKKRALRFRVLMALFSASRFGELALDLFGDNVRGGTRARSF
jgi:hypothetical protein